MRILLYTGKGGVGKTSVSAACALRCAELGYRTIVLSTDSAHSLGDSFNTSIGNEAVELAPNLWGQEIDLLFRWTNTGDACRSISMSSSPGAVWIRWSQKKRLSCRVWKNSPALCILHTWPTAAPMIRSWIDAAPTGSTLQLLSFPDIARWYIEKIMPFERRTLQIARPIMSRMSDIPLPDDDLFASVEDLVNVLERTSFLLSDSSVSSMRLVINPEKMVIKEAQRAYAYLNLYGYTVDSVVCTASFHKNCRMNTLAAGSKRNGAIWPSLKKNFNHFQSPESPSSKRRF